MRRSFMALLVLILAVGVQAKRAQADFTVSVGSATIAEGGTGYVDVTISSVGPTSLPLGNAGFTFNITANNNANTLEFVSLQPQDQSPLPASAYLNDPGYVFHGDSYDQINGLAVGNVSSTSSGTNDQYDGGDSTSSGTNTLVPTTGALLVRLSLTAALDAQPVAGDTFTIMLTPTANTAFKTEADLDSGSQEPYTTTAGTVTITARSVPEPGSFVLIALGIPAAAWALYRKRLMSAAI